MLPLHTAAILHTEWSTHTHTRTKYTQKSTMNLFIDNYILSHGVPGINNNKTNRKPNERWKKYCEYPAVFTYVFRLILLLLLLLLLRMGIFVSFLFSLNVFFPSSVVCLVGWRCMLSVTNWLGRCFSRVDLAVSACFVANSMHLYFFRFLILNIWFEDRVVIVVFAERNPWRKNVHAKYYRQLMVTGLGIYAFVHLFCEWIEALRSNRRNRIIDVTCKYFGK